MPDKQIKAAGLLSIMPNLQTKTLSLRFRDSLNQVYVVELPQPLLGILTVGLMTQASHIAPAPNQPGGAAQPMNLDSGRIFTLDDGRSGLELTMEKTIRLPLLFPKSAIPGLRTALDELERIPEKGPSQTTH